MAIGMRVAIRKWLFVATDYSMRIASQRD
jgi:hypothetical protein